MIEAYFRQVNEGLEYIVENEFENIESAAKKVTESITRNGIIHVFGCGHSHIMAEELFFRAGGLACVNPILVEPIMLHEGAVRSSEYERSEEFGLHLLDEYHITPNDVLIVVSTSGRNPVPIDVALRAKEKGCFVIALTSFHYSNLLSRHKSGKHLSEIADIAINNHVELGDAVLSHRNIAIPFSPVSSIYNMTILHAMISNAIVLLTENGGSPPIFLSGNIDHADEHNRQLIELYKEKIPLLGSHK